ncbi:hypothetical protein [Neokomagataea anthophila]|uniref:Alpha/beta hydrolase n=1 Tax=Neokomagataea anthophila TaxID=2826925 RepID=A0ABS5E435_9PROT|nr:hypothetical protein [Neokomagataea anthophila]MBR0558658.1 hypothetical protein [Neokomagataea anthophila]
MKNFSNRILYGGSMGGYAAIKFSRLFSATHVLSLCPQWSLDPDEWDRDDFGFDGHFNASMRGMGIKREDVSGEIYVFTDRFDQNDFNHFLKIKENVSNVHYINVPFVGHDVTTVFAGTSRLLDIVKYFISGDIISLIQISRNARKSFTSYVERVENIAIEKYPRLTAKRIIQNNVFPGYISLLPVIVSILKKENKLEYAIFLLNKFLEKTPINSCEIDILFSSALMIGKNIVVMTAHRKILSVDVMSMMLAQCDISYREWEFPILLDPYNKTYLMSKINSSSVVVHEINENKISLSRGVYGVSLKVDLLPAEGNKFHMKYNDLYLCAEPSGVIGFNRTHPAAWEEFYFQAL